VSTSDRLLAVLGLFTIEQPEWTVEAGAKQLGLAVSTAYRYFRSLSGAGLIITFSTGRYVLGPAITQYDRQMRLLDPLITNALPTMKRLAELAPPRTVILLCRLYRNQVMCVHQEFAERPDFAVSYERGRPMPLFRGASSKIILAHMGSRAVKALYAHFHAEMARFGLGASWGEVKQRLRELRTAGVAITQAELDPGMTGIAAPVLAAEGTVVGSISMAIPVKARTRESVAQMVELLRDAGKEMHWALSVLAAGYDAKSSQIPLRSARGSEVRSARHGQRSRIHGKPRGTKHSRK